MVIRQETEVRMRHLIHSYGHSIYATTLLPCSTGCLDKTIYEKREVFECFANIRMENTSDYEISTMGEKITPQFNKSRIYVIPGKEIELPINLTDELNNEVIHYIMLP